MEIDRSDDADVPDNPADRPSAARDGGSQTGEPQAEARYRQEYYLDLRHAAAIEEQTEPAMRAEPGARSKAAEPDENRQQPKPTEKAA